MERHGSTKTQLSGTSDFCSEVLKSGISVAVLVAEGEEEHFITSVQF